MQVLVKNTLFKTWLCNVLKYPGKPSLAGACWAQTEDPPGCGAASPSQGRWDPDSLRPALSLGADDTTLMAESKELKRLLMKVKEESEKVGLKFSFQKTKIMASGPMTSWQIDGETIETVRDLFSWAPKSLMMLNSSLQHSLTQNSPASAQALVSARTRP